jgi:hypothetical protein
MSWHNVAQRQAEAPTAGIFGKTTPSTAHTSSGAKDVLSSQHANPLCLNPHRKMETKIIAVVCDATNNVC